MTVLDSSVIIHYLDDVDQVVEYVDQETEPPYLTPSLCVYEVLMGAVHTSAESDLQRERSRFGWVQSLDVTESVAIEAARVQDHLKESGEFLAPRDALVAATARSVGDELVAADTDFDIDGLRSSLSLTCLELPRTE